MNRENLQTGRQEAIRGFDIDGTFLECTPCGNGHINDTFMMSFDRDGETHRYSLQHMNRSVFKDPVSLMNNILHVTDYLKEQIRAQGGDPQRETLDFVCAKSGEPYFIDSFGEYWRAYHFVEDAYALEEVKDPQDFYQSAVAFGHFQRLLADYPAETLHETIKDFHNTPDRLEKFKKAVAEDICGRAASVQKEIDFILEREELTHALYDLQLDGRLPLRVTHNDTKLNNIMIDDETGKAICVIDLDTVMPGLTANDFGDSIRFGASTALEDEQDLSKVSCDLHLFDVYARGFIEGCGGALTDLEIDMLPMGAILMTFENGIRFLTDHLEGDHYFHIHREGHNLDRCRTQLTLVKDMQEKLPQMNAIIQKYK